MEENQITEILAKIDTMKQVITGFIDVILKENAALKVNDVKTTKALYEQKLKTIVLPALYVRDRWLLAKIL